MIGVTPDTFLVDFGAGEFGVKNVNLNLKRFQEIETPVEIKHVSLGDVRLSIPALWKLTKSPVKVKVEKLFIVVGPSNVSRYTIDERKARMKATKKLALFVMGIINGAPTPPEYADLKNKSAKTKRILTSPELFGLPGIVKKLVPIVDNAQIEVCNIHIRYEDAISKPTNPFAVGVCLDSVAVRGSTTAQGKDTFVTEWNIDNFRKVFLNNFSLYIDTEGKGAAQLANAATKPRMNDLIYRGHSAPNAYSEEHEFLVQPLSLGARAQWHRGYDEKIPMVDVNAAIPHVGLTVSHAQYTRALDAVSHYSNYAARLKFGYLAPPSESPKANPRAWWRYVVGCVLRRVRHRLKRYKPERVFRRLTDRTTYINIMREKQLLGSGWLSSDDKKKIEEIELSLKYRDIIQFRKMAKLSVLRDVKTDRVPKFGFVAKAPPALKAAALIGAITLISLFLMIFLPFKAVAAFAIVAISVGLGLGAKFLFGKPSGMLPFDESQDNWNWIFRQLGQNTGTEVAPIEEGDPVFPREYQLVTFNASIPRVQVDVNMFGSRPYDSSILTLAVDGIHAMGSVGMPSIFIKASVDTINAVERVSLPERKPLHFMAHIYPRATIESRDESHNIDTAIKGVDNQNRMRHLRDSLGSSNNSSSTHPSSASPPAMGVLIDRVDVSNLVLGALNRLHQTSDELVQRRFVNVDISIKPNSELDVGVKVITTTFNVNASIPFINSMMGFFTPQKNKAEIREMTHAASLRVAVQTIDSVKAAIRNRQVIALDISIAGPTVVFAQGYRPGVETDALFVRVGPVALASNPERVSDPDNWTEEDCYDLYKIDARCLSVTMQRGIWHDVSTSRRISAAMSVADTHVHSELNVPSSHVSNVAIEDLSDVDTTLRPLLQTRLSKKVDEDGDTINDSNDKKDEGADSTDDDDSDVEFVSDDSEPEFTSKPLSPRPSIEEPADEKQKKRSIKKKASQSSSAAPSDTSPTIEKVKDKSKKVKKEKHGDHEHKHKHKKEKAHDPASPRASQNPLSSSSPTSKPRIEEPLEVIENPVSYDFTDGFVVSEESYVLRPMSVAVKAYVCNAGSIVGLAATKVHGDVTNLDLVVSPSRLHKILAICMAQFPPMTAKKVKKVAREPLLPKSYTPAAPPGVADSSTKVRRKRSLVSSSGSAGGAGSNATASSAPGYGSPNAQRQQRPITVYEEIEVPTGRHRKKNETMLLERHASGSAVVEEDGTLNVMKATAPSATTEDAKAAVARGEIPPELASDEATENAKIQAEKSAALDAEYAQSLQEVVEAAAKVAEKVDRPEPGQEPHDYAPVSDLDDEVSFGKYIGLKLPDFRPLLLGVFQVVGVAIHICQDAEETDPMASSHGSRSQKASRALAAFGKRSAKTIAKIIVGPVTVNVDIGPYISSISGKVSFVHFEEFVDETFKLMPEKSSRVSEADRSFVMLLDHPDHGALSVDLKLIPQDSPVFSDTLADFLVNIGKLEVNVRRPALLVLTKLAVSCIPPNFVLPAFGVHPALPVLKMTDLPSIGLEGEIDAHYQRTGSFVVKDHPQEPPTAGAEVSGTESSQRAASPSSESASGPQAGPVAAIGQGVAAGKSSASSSPHLRVPTPTTASFTTDIATADDNAAQATDTTAETADTTESASVTANAVSADADDLSSGKQRDDSSSEFVLRPIPVQSVTNRSTPRSGASSSRDVSGSRNRLVDDFYDGDSVPVSARSDYDDDNIDEDDDDTDYSDAEDKSPQQDVSDRDYGMPLAHGTVGGADLQPVFIEVEPDDGVVENLREKESVRAIVVRANVPAACFHLMQDTTKLLSLAVTNVVSTVDVRGDQKMVVQGRVGRLSVDAAHDGIGGVNMIGIPHDEDKLMDFSFCMTPSSCTDYEGHDMRVSTQIAQIRATYFHVVVMSLVQWSTNLMEPLLIILKPLKAPIKLTREARKARRAYRKTLIATGDEYMLRMSAQSLPRKYSSKKAADEALAKRSASLLDKIVLPKGPDPTQAQTKLTPSVYSTMSVAADHMPTALATTADEESSSPPAPLEFTPLKSTKTTTTKKKKTKSSKKSTGDLDESAGFEESVDGSLSVSSILGTPVSSKKSKKTPKHHALFTEDSEEDDKTSDDSDAGSALPSPRSTQSDPKKSKKKVKKHHRERSGSSVDDKDLSESEGKTDLRRHSIAGLPSDTPSKRFSSTDLSGLDADFEPLVVSPRKHVSRSHLKRAESSGTEKKSKDHDNGDKPKKKKKKSQEETGGSGGLTQPKIKIEAIIASPVLILPVNPNDIDNGGYLQVNAGRIEIENEILVAGENLVTDTLQFSLTHMHMVFHMPRSVQTAPEITLMDHTGITASVQRVLGGDAGHSLPIIGIDLEMLPVHVSFGTPQLDLIFHMLSQHILLPIPRDYEVTQFFSPLSTDERSYYNYEQRMLAALEIQERVTAWRNKHPSVDPLSPNEAYAAIRVSARVLHFAFDICDAHMIPQMKIDVRQLGALVKIHSDGFTAVEAALQSIGVLDTVISTEHFNTLFGKPTRITEPMIQLAFILNPGANTMGIKSAVHSPTIVLMPETMLRLRNTWEQPIMRGVSGLKELTSNNNGGSANFATTQPSPDPDAKREEVPNMMPTIKCGVLISSPMIAIVPVANSSSTPGFTIDLGEIVINVDMEPQRKFVAATLGISNLRVIRSFLTAGTLQSTDEQHLLHPMELKSSAIVNGPKINISAILPLVQFITSFRDVSLIMRITEAYKPLMEAIAPGDLSKRPRGALDQTTTNGGTTTASTMASSADTITDNKSDDSSPISASAAAAMASEEKQTITGSLEIVAIDIAVIDDRFKGDFFVPIFRSTLGPLHGRFHMIDRKMEGTFGFKNVAASVYNRPYGGWEPTLEPWEMSAGFQKDPRTGISARMVAEKHMEFTINHALLEAVFELLEIVIPPTAESAQQKKKRRKQALQPTLDPLVIRNFTGVPVTVQLKEVSEPFEVGSGESRPLLMKRMTRADVIAKPPRYTFSVFVQGASAPAKLNATRVSTMIVPYILEEPDSIYVAEVETDQGSRIITVRGTYKVKNMTSTAIEIMLTRLDGTPLYVESAKENKHGEEEKEKKPQVITVEPNGGTFCASLVQSATRAVRIRSLGYEWSECIQFTQPKPAYILHCKEKLNSESTTDLGKATQGCDWYATARVDVGNEGDDYSLVIAPPINVENLCTVPIQVKFVNLKKEKNAMKAIAKEEKESLKANAKDREKERKLKDERESREGSATLSRSVSGAPLAFSSEDDDDSATPDQGRASSLHSREPSERFDRTGGHSRDPSSFSENHSRNPSFNASDLSSSTASVSRYDSSHNIPSWDVIECDDEDIHQLPSFDETLAICVKLPDYGWSKPLPFVTKVDIKRTDKFDSDIVISKTVELPDQNGYLLKIGVDVATTDTSARNVKIFSRAWIVNDTGLPLFFKKDKDEKNLAAGQHNFKGFDTRMHTDGHKREMKAALSASSAAAGVRSRLESDDQHKWYENPADLIAEVGDEAEGKVDDSGREIDPDADNHRPDFSAPTIHNVSSTRELKKAARARLDAEMASTHYQNSSFIRENFNSRSISPGYGPYYYYGEKRTCISLENSSWSSASDLGVRDEGTIDLEDSATGRLYSFFIAVTPGPARFWRTSVVRIYPRFVLSNSSPFPLVVRQITQAHDAPTALRLEPGEMLPYHWASYKHEQILAAHVADRPHLCSGYFGLDQVGRFPLRFHDTKMLAPTKHGKRTLCTPIPIPSCLDDNLFFAGLHITNIGDSSIFVRFLDDAPEEYFTISNQTTSEIVVREYQSDSKLAKLRLPGRDKEGASLATSVATVDRSGLDDTEDDVSTELDDSEYNDEAPALINAGGGSGGSGGDGLIAHSPSSSSAPATTDDSKLSEKEKKAKAKEAEKSRKEQEKAAKKSAKEASKEAAKNAKILTPSPGDESFATATNTTYDDTSMATNATSTSTKKKKKKHQVPVEVDEDDAELRGAQIYILKPKRKEAFIFPRPQHPKHKIQFQLPGDSTWHDVNLDKIQQKPSIKLADRRYVHIRTAAVGQSKQLIIKIASKEAKTDEEQLAAAGDSSSMKFELLMAGVGISVVDQKPQELMYARMGGIQVNVGMNTLEQNLEVKLGMMQIDNDLYLTPHSVVAHSIDQPDGEPFFHLSLVRDMRYQKFFCFRYFSMKMHKLATKLDMAFAMNALVWGLKLVKWVGERTAAEVEQKAIMGEGEGKIKTPYVSATSNGFYFEVFHLNPMSFIISFVPSSNFDCPTADDASAAMIASISPHLMTINEAPLFLGGLLMTNCFTSQDEFIARITAHYIKSVLKQLLMLAGSADALGNPVSLVNSLGTGVYDLVHEPAAGATQSPAKFGIGLAKGAGSMIKHSLGGLLASAEKIVGNVSKLGEKISMDKEYQQDRERMKMKRANHVGAGVGLGLKEFGQGLIQGVAGVVTQPVKGARKQGFKGFAAGIGKGLVGVVIKPTVGVVDLVTRTTEGIRNTGSDTKNVERIRDPRFIGSDRLLPLYDAYKAEGQLFLRTINDGRFKREFYAWHKAPSHKTMVIVTNTRIMYLKHHTIDKVVSSGSKWSVKWREQLLLFSEVITRDTTRSKLILSTKDDSENQGNTLAISTSAKPPTADDAPSAAENSNNEPPQSDTTKKDDTNKKNDTTAQSGSSSGDKSKDKLSGKDKALEKSLQISGGSSGSSKKPQDKPQQDKTTQQDKDVASPSKSDKSKELVRSPSKASASSAEAHVWKIKYSETSDADEMEEQLVFYIQEAPMERPRAKALSLLRNFNPKLLLGHKRRATAKKEVISKEKELIAKEKEAKKMAKKLLHGHHPHHSKSSSSSPSAADTPASGGSLASTAEDVPKPKDSWSSEDESSSATTTPTITRTPSKKERRKSITSPGIPQETEKKREKMSKRAETDAPASPSTSLLATPDEKKKSKRLSRALSAGTTDTSDAEGTPQKSPRKDKKEKKSKTPRDSTADASSSKPNEDAE